MDDRAVRAAHRGWLGRCSYCGRDRGDGKHNGRGGHLFLTRAAMLGWSDLLLMRKAA